MLCIRTSGHRVFPAFTVALYWWATGSPFLQHAALEWLFKVFVSAAWYGNIEVNRTSNWQPPSMGAVQLPESFLVFAQVPRGVLDVTKQQFGKTSFTHGEQKSDERSIVSLKDFRLLPEVS